MVEIEYAHSDDIEGLKLFSNSMDNVNYISHKIEKREIVCAKDAGAIVGCLRLEWLWNSFPFVTMVEVIPSYQRQGIGTALMHFMLIELSHKTILLSSTREDNPNSIAWHTKMGFQRCGIWEGTHKDGCNELFFKKEVS